MEDILKEINFNKFDNTHNSKIKEKLKIILKRKLKMDKLVDKNARYDIDYKYENNNNNNNKDYENKNENDYNNEYDFKNSNNILIDNLDSCINDHIVLFKKVESDVDTNIKYLKKMKNISELFEKINQHYDLDLDEKSKLYFLN
jgi:hypothetical protein